MDVAVHRGLNIRVSCDGLQRLDVRHDGLGVGQEAVPENMRRRTMQVDGLRNSLERPLEGHLRNGVVTADDECWLLRIFLYSDATLF